MSHSHKHPRRSHAPARATLFAALALLSSSCAGAGGVVETGRPRTDVPYPVVLNASDERRTKALAAWRALASAQGSSAALADVPEIDPVTGTLRTLPATTTPALRIPFVGSSETNEMTDEDEREALRRFIAENATLLGVEPADLSLVEQKSPDGATPGVARYQQNPFDFPLRGDYGRLEISYAQDRRVVSLTNTAVPDAPQLERSLAGARTLKADEVTRTLVGRSVSFTDRNGQQRTRAVASPEEISLREIVVYPVRGESGAQSLTLHLAWEVVVWQDAPVLLYLDAVTGAQLAAAPAPAS